MGMVSTTPTTPSPNPTPATPSHSPLVPLYVQGLINIRSKSNIEPDSTKSYLIWNVVGDERTSTENERC